VTAFAWAVMYERGELEALTPGDEAWGVFGRGQVTEIYARGVSCNGHYYVCCYIHYPDGLTCSESLREGAVIRNVSLISLFSSAEIDDIERNMLADMRNGGLVVHGGACDCLVRRDEK
jgi:hypothetical protein